MSRSVDAPKRYDSSSDWCYFGPPPGRDRLPDYIHIPDLNQLIPNVTKMVSMTKFDGTWAASRWIRVLKEELTGQLSPGTWLERADSRLEVQAASWAETTPKIIRILSINTIENATIEDKNTFIQLLLQEFPGNSRDAITDEQASTALLSLSQKEGEDLHTYYRRSEGLLKAIHGRDRVTNNSADTIILSPAEAQLLKEIVIKFIFGIRDLDLQLRVIEYRANPMPSLYGAYKSAETHLIVLQIQAQVQEIRQKQREYEASRYFQASVGND